MWIVGDLPATFHHHGIERVHTLSSFPPPTPSATMAAMAFITSTSPLSRLRCATAAGTAGIHRRPWRPAVCRPPPPRATVTPPPPLPPSPPPPPPPPAPAASLASIGRRAIPAAAWAAYINHLFLAQPASITTTTADALREAVDLSLNFLFILPAAAPSVAPVVHPALEGLFMLVVGWAGVLWVFAADGYEGASSASEGGGGGEAGTPRPGVPVVPFLVGAAFLTNGMRRRWCGRPHSCVRVMLPE